METILERVLAAFEKRLAEGEGFGVHRAQNLGQLLRRLKAAKPDEIIALLAGPDGDPR